MSDKQKGYFSTREAAERLGVAVSTIQLWTNNGLLRAWRTSGGHRRIERSSVEEVLNQGQGVSHEQTQEKPLSIVVVEDNGQQLRLYEKQFIAWRVNARVVVAKDGYEGLIRIGRTLPDVIITDLNMPNMDGFELIKALKSIPELEHSLIIVVTGLTDEEIKERGSLPPEVHLFTKPIPFDELEALLRQKVNSLAA